MSLICVLAGAMALPPSWVGITCPRGAVFLGRGTQVRGGHLVPCLLRTRLVEIEPVTDRKLCR